MTIKTLPDGLAWVNLNDLLNHGAVQEAARAAAAPLACDPQFANRAGAVLVHAKAGAADRAGRVWELLARDYGPQLAQAQAVWASWVRLGLADQVAYDRATAAAA